MDLSMSGGIHPQAEVMPSAISDTFYKQHNDYRFRVPVDLSSNPTDIRRILLVGSCFAEGLAPTFAQMSGGNVDFLLHPNYRGLAHNLPSQPPHAISEYNFQLILLPARYLLSEYLYIRLSPDEPQQYSDFFDEAEQILIRGLESALQYNHTHTLLTFVANFLVPQQNPMSRLLPRYDLRNLAFFVDRLNQTLAKALSAKKNVYLLDVDAIANSFGKKYIHDEIMCESGHGTWLSDWGYELDAGRIERRPPPSSHYEIRADEFRRAIWQELLASYRTVRQADCVNLVVVDLDDTLWRGTFGDDALSDVPIEGWPFALSETLLYLKKRGILLAIISKNDRTRIEAAWRDIFGALISLDDFASAKINWLSKAQNMSAVLGEVNLLPKNVVFIDDNPVERAAMQSAFPEIRVLGSHPYYLKRILLWSAETQLPIITDESLRRTQMMQAQIQREQTRQILSRSEFLASLELKVEIFKVTDNNDPQFPRLFELLNKTNQFNTTGRRWNLEEMVSLISHGVTLIAFGAEDKYTKYGLVGVVIIGDAMIEQFVMSCRVVGLEIEQTVLNTVTADLFTNGRRSAVSAKFVPTSSNGVCRDLYKDAGFICRDGVWVLGRARPVAAPKHIQLV
jgi:FkbH-like protein